MCTSLNTRHTKFQLRLHLWLMVFFCSLPISANVWSKPSGRKMGSQPKVSSWHDRGRTMVPSVRPTKRCGSSSGPGHQMGTLSPTTMDQQQRGWRGFDPASESVRLT